MVALCTGMVLWLALSWRAKKLKKRREEAKERQERRMGGGNVGGEEGVGTSGEAPIPLQSMRGEEDGRIPRPERVYSNGIFGGRSEIGSPSSGYGEHGRDPWASL